MSVPNTADTYFFCGIGGSGMMPLAVLLKKKGLHVIGSDRSYDLGVLPEKFKALQDIGIEIFPQDGSGISNNVNHLVVSSAIEKTIPDIRTALELNIPIIKRGELLANNFNEADTKISVAGTSGKSTVTGMIGVILEHMGQDPTLVNGGEILKFRSHKDDKFSGIRRGRDDLFLAEMDESDGSIAHYNPDFAVLNNVALDHKSMDELDILFGEYLERATRGVIINMDNKRANDLLQKRDVSAPILSYSLINKEADLYAADIVQRPDGVEFNLHYGGGVHEVHLRVIGRYNVSNVLAAIGVCIDMNLDIKQIIAGIEEFTGIHRRMEVVGSVNNITVIDDFAHNPDKISASLDALKAFDGRLILMFQPHGFGPLRLMGAKMVDIFTKFLGKDDFLLMPEAYYAGGTVDRSITAKNLIADLKERGIDAHWFASRAEIIPFIMDIVKPDDRIIIMGARDDSLHDFAHDILDSL